jgi:two-component sensor histidine kinase
MTVSAGRDGDTARYGRALLNILEDFAAEREQLRETQRAMSNLLEDFAEEKTELERAKRAVLNILEDLAVEKDRLEDTQRSVVRSESALRASLHEKEVLLREVHHRVKNNLQLIASLLSLQGRCLHDPQSRLIMEESQSRIRSIALAHETLYRSGELARIDLGRYLGTLVQHLLDSWMGVSGRVVLSVDAARLDVAIDAAIPCGLIVNELVTNAFKHAFPGERRGQVRVSAQLGAPGQAILQVADDGVGIPAVVRSTRSGGLGLELVATLTRQLRAVFHLGEGPGTMFTITLPYVQGGEDRGPEAGVRAQR